MSKAVDDLKHEHEAIVFTLSVLDKMVALMREGEKVPHQDLMDITGFLKEFGDTCHHGKEEKYLFPALENRGIFEADNLTANLRAEHDLGRNLVFRMVDSLKDPEDPSRFIQSAEEYTGLLRSHTEKEDRLLFPMTEAHIPRSVLEEMYEGFEDHEETVIGHGRHEELHAMLDSFEKKYLR